MPRSSWTPGRQWDYFTGGDDLDAVVTVDEARLDAKLAELSEGLGTPPKDGAGASSARCGRSARPPPRRVGPSTPTRRSTPSRRAYLGHEDSAELNVVAAEPDIDAADVDDGGRDLAEPAVSDPVTLVFGESEVTLPPAAFANGAADGAGERRSWSLRVDQ